MLKLATKFLPRPEAFAVAHRAGFGYAELWLDAEVLANWQTVASVASAFPLEYALHFPNRLDAPEPGLEQTVSLYRALDCRCLVIHQPMFDRHAAALLALEPNLQLAIENHKLTPDQLAHWAEESPGLALDFEHLWKFTLRDAPLAEMIAAAREMLNRHAAKLRHVHMPGYLPGYAEHRPMYCAREMVFPTLDLLAEVRYRGLTVSEVNQEFQNPNDLRMDVLLFDTWVAKHAGASVFR
jgi:hypothetical protein